MTDSLKNIARTSTGMVLAALTAITFAGCGQFGGAGSNLNPVGRYQLAGKREYSNGTEIYFLDTTRGRVCSSFIPKDDNDPKNIQSLDCSVSEAFGAY